MDAEHDAATEAARPESFDTHLERVAFESLYDTIPVALCIVDRQLRLVRVNGKFAELLDQPEHCLPGTRLSDVAPHFAEAAQRSIHRVLSSGKAILGEEAGVGANPQTGAERIWRASWVPIKVQDEIMGVHVSIDDITQDKSAPPAEALRANDLLRQALSALEDRSRELETVLEALPIAVWRCDATGEHVFGNRAAYETFGWPPGINVSLRPEPLPPALAGTRLLLDGKEVTPDLMPLQRAARYGEPSQHRLLEVILPTGDTHVVDVNIVPLRNQHGELRGAIGAYSDVTALKRIEAELRESEERFRVALESSAVPFALLHAVRDASGRIVDFEWTYINTAAAKLSRRSASELLGHRVEEIHPGTWAAAPDLFQAYARAVESGQSEHLDLRLNTHEVDGWFHLVASKFGDGVSTWLADVTESRRAAQQALQAQRELQAVTSLMLAGVTRCTADFRYVWVSPTYAKRLGRRADELAGRPIREILGEAAFKVLLPVYTAVLAGEQTEFEGEIDYPIIGRRWIHAAYVPSRDSQGRIDGWVAVVYDATERKRIELQLIEADRRKNEFLAVLAHELRNPLAPLRNGVQIARLSAHADSVLSRTIEMMDRQLKHLVRLVDDLLDVSRITRGKVELRKSLIDLREVLASSVESCRPQIDAHGLELKVEVPDGQFIVEGDFDRLSQVFSNILTNSVKFTTRGGRISLSLACQDDVAIIEVSDNGIGIPRERLDDIFQMFSQVRSDERGAQPGLGIGLALVRGLVEMHGGSVTADSFGPGTGSRFEVRLPLAAASLEHSAASIEGASPRPRGRALRILVVDDNFDAAATLATLLRMKGHETRTANDGLDALKQAAAFEPELVFLDIGMTPMDGYETARRMREQPWSDGARLVALTGWGQEHDKRRAVEAGLHMHFTKPIEPAALDELLLTAGRSPAGVPRSNAEAALIRSREH